MQGRCNSIANTMELHLSCTNPSVCSCKIPDCVCSVAIWSMVFQYLLFSLQHYDAIMKYVSQGPMMVDVHMHRPLTNSRNFMDALLAFWPGLQVSDLMKTNQIYRPNSNIRYNKSPNLNVSCLILQLSLLNPLKPGIKSPTGNAPTTSEWWTILLPTRLQLILEVWQYCLCYFKSRNGGYKLRNIFTANIHASKIKHLRFCWNLYSPYQGVSTAYILSVFSMVYVRVSCLFLPQVLKGDIKPAIEIHEMLYQVTQRHNFLPEVSNRNQGLVLL